MKLRQKLAAALATAMIVTSVPVVTMAASNNKVVRATQIYKKDEAVTTGTSLKVEFGDATGVDEEFYITLTNAEWLEGSIVDEDCDFFTVTGDEKNTWTTTIDGITVTYTRIDGKTVRVQAESVAKDTEITLPIVMKAKGGEISVQLSAEGGDTTITEGSYVIGTTGENAASISVGEPNSFYDNGELTKITLKENYVGSLTENATVLRIELDNTDFEFTSTTTVDIKATYGLADTLIKTAKVAVDKDDKSTAYVCIPKITNTNKKSLGRLEITGLKVDNDEKEIEVGELKADIKSVEYNAIPTAVRTTLGLTTSVELNKLEKSYSDVVLANIVDYGAFIKMKDEKAVEIVAGRDEEVTFTIGETVDDCLVGGRTIEVTLDSEEYDESFFWMTYGVDYKETLISDADQRALVQSIEVVWNDDENEKAFVPTESNDEFTYENDKQYRADAIKVVLANGINTNDKKDEITFKTKVYVPVNQKDKKDLTLVAEMRGVDEIKSATAVNITNPFNVEFDQTTLKVGLQKQPAGKISITETEKEMFNKGTIEFDITASNETFDGIILEDEGKLSVSGDLKKADLEDAKGTKQVVTLKRQSKAASTLTIEEMSLTVDRTVPEGTYDLEIGGTAIDAHGGTLKLEDYIKIGTPNTQDMIAANGLARGTAVFTMGNSSYTLNGEEKVMDAQVYIQDPGYVMAPVRYVAEAFGVSETDIMFGKGTVTIFAGTRTIQLTNNSDVAVVNGVNITMSTKVAIKDSRTYAPVGEIAKILGIASDWDNTTKTATFENK